MLLHLPDSPHGITVSLCYLLLRQLTAHNEVLRPALEKRATKPPSPQDLDRKYSAENSLRVSITSIVIVNDSFAFLRLAACMSRSFQILRSRFCPALVLRFFVRAS